MLSFLFTIRFTIHCKWFMNHVVKLHVGGSFERWFLFKPFVDLFAIIYIYIIRMIYVLLYDELRCFRYKSHAEI